MVNLKFVMILLCIVLILVVGWQREKDIEKEVIGPGDRAHVNILEGDDDWSDKLVGQANLVLILNNQCPNAPSLQGHINVIPIFLW